MQWVFLRKTAIGLLVLLGQYLLALDTLVVSHQTWEAVEEVSLLKREVIFSKRTQVETIADKKGAGVL